MHTRERAALAAAAIAAAFSSTFVSASPSAAAQVPHPQIAAQLSMLAPAAIAWAERTSAETLKSGAPLPARLQDLARANGVRDPDKVRVVVMDRIPLPEEPQLKAAALGVGLSASWASGMTLGYAVMIRRGFEDDVRVLSHELRHVAQYEACGGIKPFLSIHLANLAEFGYEDSPFEVDARAHERDKL